MSWIDGRVAVVTGAGRGIGRATAEALAGRGARVVMASRTASELEEAASSIDGAVAVPTDVGEPKQVDRLFDRAADLGPVTVLVSAAAILQKGYLHDLTLSEWRRSVDVNLTGTFLCLQHAVRSMREAGGGRIVTLSSLSGVYGPEKFPGLGAYNTTKYGVVGLTETVAVEGRDAGISAVCLAPGAVDTQMLREAAPHLDPGLGPKDVAETIVTLLSDPMVAASGAVIPLFSNR